MNKTTERLVVGGVAILVGLLLGWMVRGLATYNTAMETAVSYDDWRVVCPAAKTKDLACEMSSDVQDPKSKQTVARVSITKDKGKQVIGFTLPFDVALEPGLGLQIGKDNQQPKVYQYRTCNTVGCLAVEPADDKFLTTFGSANALTLLFIGARSADNKPVGIPISLKGYAAARRGYQGSESKRNAWFWRLWS